MVSIFSNYIPQFQLLFTIKYVKFFPCEKIKPQVSPYSIHMLTTIFDYFSLDIYNSSEIKITKGSTLLFQRQEEIH